MVAITLSVALAVGVATLGVIGNQIRNEQREAAEAAQQARRTGPLALPPVAAPEANSPECAAVLAALPPELRIDGQRVPRRTLARPTPPATVAWGDVRHDPVTVRCGMDAPAELTPTSPLVEISGVGWLELNAGDTTSWLAVDRPVYLALTAPGGSGSGPVQDLSKILREQLPKQEVFP